MIFHFILARKHGEVAGYPIAAAFDDAGLLALVAKYNELTSGAGQKSFAAENSELLFATVDGESLSVRHTHQFADPSAVESRRQAAALAEALRIQGEQDTAQANLEQAKERLDGAKHAIRKLSPEHKELLAKHANRIAAAHAATQPRDLPSEAEQQAARDRIAASSKAQRKAAAESAGGATAALKSSVIDGSGEPAPRVVVVPTFEEVVAAGYSEKAAKKIVRHEQAKFEINAANPNLSDLDLDDAATAQLAKEDSLDSHTIEELKEIAATEKADLTGLSLKADIIAAIELNRAPLEERTIDQLKDLAAAENIDLTGCTLKAEIISAIEAHRAAPPAL